MTEVYYCWNFPLHIWQRASRKLGKHLYIYGCSRRGQAVPFKSSFCCCCCCFYIDFFLIHSFWCRCWKQASFAQLFHFHVWHFPTRCYSATTFLVRRARSGRRRVALTAQRCHVRHCFKHCMGCNTMYINFTNGCVKYTNTCPTPLNARRRRL